MNITPLLFMIEKKISLKLKKSNFLFPLCFKIAMIQFIPINCNDSVYSNVSAIRTEKQFFSQLFCFKVDVFSVFTWYDIGCKHNLQLKIA